MTQQMFSFKCSDIRKHAYEYRNEEMAEADIKRFDLHLCDCASCKEYLGRLTGMLDASTEYNYAESIDKNTLFSSILSELSEAPDEPQTPVVAIETLEDEFIPKTSYPLKKTIFWGILTLAAGVLIGGYFSHFFENSGPSIAKGRVKTGVEDPSRNPKYPIPFPILELAFQPTLDKNDSLNIYGDENAEWSIAGMKEQTFHLKEGRVLIEYVPSASDSSLKLVDENYTIHVLGTVFYASHKTGVIGVVTGKVRVETKNGKTIVLERGQEYVPNIGIRNTALATLSATESLIDLKEHQQKLEMVKTLKKVKKKNPSVAKLPKSDLRKAADIAIRKRDYKLAAKLLERMVVELPASAPENATLRLDLSRIYIRHLKQPRRAIRHLKTFTQQRPLDPATPSAVNEMCRISKRFGVRDPICEQR